MTTSQRPTLEPSATAALGHAYSRRWDRIAEQAIADRNHAEALLHDLYRELTAAAEGGASSNDIAQLVDDWFTRHGYQTFLYT